MKRNDLLKIIAILCMLIDHIGAVLFPKIFWLRIIGRIAFPIFAFQVAMGFSHTKNIYKYGLRLLIFGLISQIPYGLLFPGNINIFFTLLWGLFLLFAYERNVLVSLLLVPLAAIFGLEYGWYGVAAIFVFHHFRHKPLYAAAAFSFITLLDCIVTVLQSGFLGIFVQMFSLFALFLIYHPFKTQIQLPKYFFYAFYPVHLLILFLLK